MPSISIHPVKLLCCLLLCSGAVQAKQSDYKEQIFVDASSQQAELAINKVTYFGPVTITQGTTKITADDKVEIIRHDKPGSEEIIAYGKPATFFQILDNGKPVTGKANKLNYKLKEKLIVLTDNAELKQYDSQVNGDLIRYDIEKQQMNADSTKKGSRVRSVFMPEQLQEQAPNRKDGK